MGYRLANNIETEFKNSVVNSRDNIFQLSTLDATKLGVEENQSVSVPRNWQKCIANELHHVLPRKVSSVILSAVEEIGIGILSKEILRSSLLPDSSDTLPRWQDHSVYCLHHFTPHQNVKNLLGEWKKERLLWWKRLMNNNPNVSEERSTSSSVIKYHFPWATECVERIQILDETFTYNQEAENQLGCIEITFELERAAMATLCDSYEERTESQTPVLQLHPRLAPTQIGILVAKEQLESTLSLARRLKKELRIAGISSHVIPTESIEAISNDLDAIGTPYSIFIDAESTKSGIVPLRHRNTAILEYMHLAEVQPTLQSLLKRR